MKVLVTGAAGFIGYHLTRRLLGRGDEVVGLDSINDYYDPALKYARLAELGIARDAADAGPVRSVRFAGFEFRRLAIEDRAAMEAVFGEHRFDRVCNLAAQAGVRYSLENPRAYIESNVAGFINVLECCRQAHVAHLVYASSSSVYGLGTSRPFSVHAAVNHPASLYAATKRADELMAHTYSHLFGLPTTGLRFFTVYGPWGRPDMAYYKFAELMSAGREIDIYNNGDMLRDFTYIDDIVDGAVRVLDGIPTGDACWNPEHPDPASSSAPYRIYNLGNNKPERLADFIGELERTLDIRARKRYLPMQAGDVYATEADIQDMERDFGWRPRTAIRQGLDSFAQWYRAYTRSKTSGLNAERAS